jgi:hypothetical protein
MNNLYFLNFCRFLTAIIVTLAIAGGIKAFSGIPFWDMWNGHLGFFSKVMNGEQAAWWIQHNEHRIVLSRALFWLDLKLFNGSEWFLISINYFLIAISSFIFYRLVDQQSKNLQSKNTKDLLFLLICSLLFFWAQENNMTWGFQSQFILAQLLPLTTFYVFYLSHNSNTPYQSIGFFWLSCLFGVLSLGSMANGVLALPLLLVMSFILRASVFRKLTIAALSAVFIYLYFLGYKSPASHGSLTQSLLNNPLDVAAYVLLYLGGPFYYLSGKDSYMITGIAGLFLILSSIAFFIKLIISEKKNPLTAAMLMFLIYIGGTALGTASGRVIFGIDQALSSRYMTPALMAWSTLIILYLPYIERKYIENKKLVNIVVGLVFLSLLPTQRHALDSQSDKFFEHKVAALALELGIKDQTQIGQVFPSSEWALAIVEQPVERNHSIFGQFPFVNLREQIGDSTQTKFKHECRGSIDESFYIDDARFVRVRGWIYSPDTSSSPELVRILDQEGHVVGFAVTGQSRPDVANAVAIAAGSSGFKGYIDSTKADSKLTLQGMGPNCELHAHGSITPYKVKPSQATTNQPTTNSAQLDGFNEWQGSDFFKTKTGGLKILGSVINSDADTGAVRLTLKKGDTVLYRSGPTISHQKLKINGTVYPLPLAIEWVMLEFSNPNLPIQFQAEFSDQGVGWGEWSAIAVKDAK